MSQTSSLSQPAEKSHPQHTAEMRARYRLYISSLCKRYTNLKLLANFLHSKTGLYTGRVTCLDFNPSGFVTKTSVLNISKCADTVHRLESSASQGQMIIIEDLTREIIEVIGSSFNVDPTFFAYHLYEARSDVESLQRLSYLLPSSVHKKNFACFKYLQTVSFNIRGVSPPSRLICKYNVQRKVCLCTAAGSISGNDYVGVIQRKVTILKKKDEPGSWKCFVLVDPPAGNNFFSDNKDCPDLQSYTAQTRLVQGGYIDFHGSPTFDEDEWDEDVGPNRISLLEDLAHYWTNAGQSTMEFFSPSQEPTLLDLAHYPLRVAAAEFFNVAKFLQHFIETYEKALGGTDAELRLLENDLRDIYSWRRRVIMFEENCQQVIDFYHQLSDHASNIHKPRDSNGKIEWNRPILDDFEFLKERFHSLGQRAERMIPVITSLVQIVEGRHTFQETTNLSRLTYLALVFGPLSFAASLFSINKDMALGTVKFGWYFVVAIPLLLLTFVLALWHHILAWFGVRHLGMHLWGFPVFRV